MTGVATPTHVVHVIIGLELGGAEMVLHNLLAHGDRDHFRSEVVSLTTAGPVADRIRALGVPVRALGMRQERSLVRTLSELTRLLRTTRPDLVQTWMYHADVVGGLAARAVGVPVVWDVQTGTPPPPGTKYAMKAGLGAAAVLSRVVPRAIVCCSETSRQVHRELRYTAARMTVIPNGFQVLPADPGARADVRAELGLPPEALLVLRPGRFHPQKDHATCLEAAGHLARTHPDVHWVLAGPGITSDNQELARLLQTRAGSARVHLLGPRLDMPRLNAAADAVVSSSAFGEGLPLIVGEAMAAGTPVVATDVGDTRPVIGETGSIVPARDPQRLSAAVAELLDRDAADRAELGLRAQRRIEQHYSVQSMVAQYERLYRALAGGVAVRDADSPMPSPAPGSGDAAVADS